MPQASVSFEVTEDVLVITKKTDSVTNVVKIPYRFGSVYVFKSMLEGFQWIVWLLPRGTGPRSVHLKSEPATESPAQEAAPSA